MVNKYIKKEILELVFLVSYLVLIIGIMSLFFGFGGQGFAKTEILEKNNFYIPYGAVFLIGIIMLKIAGLFIFSKKKANLEGVIVNDPERSPLKGFKIFSNPFLLAMFSIIFFSFIFWIFTSQQTFFNATPQYSQQFSTSADLFFSVFPASPVETLGAIFLISLFGLILGIFWYKNKLSSGSFLLFFILGSTFISMIYGIIDHFLRYGFSEVAMLNVAIFWAVGGLITAVTRSMIPFLVMHDLNNLFVKLAKLFSSDVITVITFSIIGVLSILFIIFYIRVKRKKVE